MYCNSDPPTHHQPGVEGRQALFHPLTVAQVIYHRKILNLTCGFHSIKKNSFAVYETCQLEKIRFSLFGFLSKRAIRS